MRRWLAGCALFAGLLLRSGWATASPDYPTELVRDLGLPATPACAVCHLEESDGAPIAAGKDSAFARALVTRGLVADDPSSLDAAVALMTDVDSDGDGARDLDELYWGGDPNQRDGPAIPPPTPVSYGCRMSTARRGTGGEDLGPWLLLLLACVTQSLPRIFLLSPRPINIDRVVASKARPKRGSGEHRCNDVDVS